MRARLLDECWWRWGRIELPVQNQVAGNVLQVCPAYECFASGSPTGGVLRALSGVPCGSLTPLTGVGDAAPPLMTSSPSGEGGRRRCSLTKQREQTDGCQLLACPRIYEAMRATSTCSSRSLSPVET